MKFTDMIVSAIIKRGILYEAKNFDTTIDIPTEKEGKEMIIKIHVKAENMSIRIDKEEA